VRANGRKRTLAHNNAASGVLRHLNDRILQAPVVRVRHNNRRFSGIESALEALELRDRLVVGTARTREGVGVHVILNEKHENFRLELANSASEGIALAPLSHTWTRATAARARAQERTKDNKTKWKKKESGRRKCTPIRVSCRAGNARASEQHAQQRVC
jgi:hypothetical protein